MGELPAISVALFDCTSNSVVHRRYGLALYQGDALSTPLEWAGAIISIMESMGICMIIKASVVKSPPSWAHSLLHKTGIQLP